MFGEVWYAVKGLDAIRLYLAYLSVSQCCGWQCRYSHARREPTYCSDCGCLSCANIFSDVSNLSLVKRLLKIILWLFTNFCLKLVRALCEWFPLQNRNNLQSIIGIVTSSSVKAFVSTWIFSLTMSGCSYRSGWRKTFGKFLPCSLFCI